ncbi:MAG TPA: class I SAM-dependent methyltransferase [Ktedonobacteraceae bacterium]|nr:class I SAM-dependent methyltransferase [Ktedonobacteraceae bacterium]
MSTNPEEENSYVLDAESGAELARLVDQDMMVTRAMGGLFPRDLDLATISRVLDVACGPGGWAIEVARTHPQMQVTGVDISGTVLQYAKAQAKVRDLDNVTFRVMDVTKPLGFSDESFDMVNARAMIGFMSNAGWSAFVQEAFRVLRPGGILRLTESDDLGFTNSAAQETLTRLGVLALERAGKTFAPPGGRNAGLTPMLGRFLRRAGFVNIRREAYAIDYSAGEPAHDSVCHDLMAIHALSIPLFTKTQVATEEEMKALSQRAVADFFSDDFCGLMYLLSVWGQKPA